MFLYQRFPGEFLQYSTANFMFSGSECEGIDLVETIKIIKHAIRGGGGKWEILNKMFLRIFL